MIQTHKNARPGADRPSDDWSGTTDPILRRKLQNRCNQRAARRRKLAAVASPPQDQIPSRHGPLHSTHHTPVDQQQQPIPTELAVLLTQRAKIVTRYWLPMHLALESSTTSTSTSASNSEGDGSDSFPTTTDSDPNERLCSRNTFASIRTAKNCSPRIAYAMTLQRLQSHTDPSSHFALPADHLISLIYYNVYRGLLQNIAILGSTWT